MNILAPFNELMSQKELTLVGGSQNSPYSYENVETLLGRCSSHCM